MQTQRSKETQFLDMKIVTQSFNLSYVDAIQVQAWFNYLLPTSQDRSKAFFNAIQKVKNNLKFIQLPKDEKIQLICVDPFLTKSSNLNKLTSFINSPINDSHPFILISFIYTKDELMSYLGNHNYPMITIEMLSPFDDKNLQFQGVGYSLLRNYQVSLYATDITNNFHEIKTPIKFIKKIPSNLK